MNLNKTFPGKKWKWCFCVEELLARLIDAMILMLDGISWKKDFPKNHKIKTLCKRGASTKLFPKKIVCTIIDERQNS